MFLIDTNIISEVRKGDRCNARVAAWYADIENADLFLSVLVTGEIRKGIEGKRGKIIIPLAYGHLDGNEGWHFKHLAPPRPLYGLHRLAARPNADVLAVEGEPPLIPDSGCFQILSLSPGRPARVTSTMQTGHP